MLENRYQAVVFDLDDTILKTSEIKWEQHRHTAKHHYGIDLSDETLREHWGKPFAELVGHLYEHSDTVERMIAANRESEDDFPKEIQDDTLETLERLEAIGMTLGIVTATSADFARQDLRIAGIPQDRFLFVQGAGDTPYHKPDPRVFDPAVKALHELGIEKHQTVYIGDALADYYAARGAGIDFLGVATGFVTVAEFRDAGAAAVPRLRDAGQLLAA